MTSGKSVSLLPYLLLTRPVNVIISGLSIFIGALVTGTIQPLNKVLLACLSGGLVAAGANTINDYFDVEIDRHNKPYRPLPAGKVSLKSAFVFSLLLLALGTICGFIINILAFIIALVSSVLLFVYSSSLKRTVLLGNIAVSFVTGLAFIYGGVAVGRLGKALIPAVFAFLFHFGREIIKDIEDIEGDRQELAKTLPIKYGTKTALIISTAVFSVLIVATFIPYLAKIFNSIYLYIVISGVDTVLVFVLFSMWRRQTSANFHFLSNLLKADMFVGLLAIYFGS